MSTNESKISLTISVQTKRSYSVKLTISLSQFFFLQQAHKLALASFSPYLEQAFQNRCDGDSIEIDMTDFPTEIVFQIVHFAYTTELNIQKDSVGQLIKCADELGFDVVLGMCSGFLQNVDIPSAVLFYSIAKNYNMEDLIPALSRFILDNFSEVCYGINYNSFIYSTVWCGYGWFDQL